MVRSDRLRITFDEVAAMIERGFWQTNGADGRVHLACSLAPPSSGSDSVGAAILRESFRQSSERLRHTSRVLRQRSERLRERCRAARASHTPAPVDASDTPILVG